MVTVSNRGPSSALHKPCALFVQIDIQHAPTDYANLAAMITAVNAAGKPVRVGRFILQADMPLTVLHSRGLPAWQRQSLHRAASSLKRLPPLVQALVRVEGPHDRGGIQQSLDLGAAGVMIPTVNSRADVQAAAAACYYPSEAYPDASRSIAFPIR
jgi:4-hydroxy-2-oxoheptanedioate aldolase